MPCIRVHVAILVAQKVRTAVHLVQRGAVWAAGVGMSIALQLIKHNILHLCFSCQESGGKSKLVRAED